MKDTKIKISIILFASLLLGCKQKADLGTSTFKVAQDYAEFSDKMGNLDTLKVGVVLSVCAWREFHQLQITKSNDSVFLQMQEQFVMDDKPVHFNKVPYKLNNDTLNLEKMMKDFDINHQNERNLPFFVIINPKEKDTVFLRTSGLGNREFNIERYQSIIAELYPNEWTAYQKEHSFPPPPPPKKLQ